MNRWPQLSLTRRGCAQVEDGLDGRLFQLWVSGDAEQVGHDAGGVQPDCAFDAIFGVDAEDPGFQRASVDVGNVGAHEKRRLIAGRDALQYGGESRGELDDIWIGADQGLNCRDGILQADEEGGFAEDSVVDSDVQESTASRVEHSIQTILLHRFS